jgi:hypothetical protein
MNHMMACISGGFPIIGRLFCLFGFHVCKDPVHMFENSNPDYFECCVCGRTIETYQK